MSVPLRSRFAVLSGVATLLCSTAAVAQPASVDSMNEDQKVFYFLGVLSAQNLAPFQLSKEELSLVERGLEDAVGGNAPDLDGRTLMARAQEIQSERAGAAAAKEKAAAAPFLEAEAAKPGVRKTPGGAIVETLKEGSGASPEPSDTVVVHYRGTLRDGSEFDSSIARGEPFTTPLNRVIPCWTEALSTMKVGEKARIVCPPDIAYGDRGAPPRIPGGAPLVFEVELLDIKK